MKRPIVLTGVSGCGKTSILQYLAHKHPDSMFAMDTGDYFKARWALAYSREFKAPPRVLIGAEAFNWFIDTQMTRGIELYEQLKVSKEVNGFDMIAWIEMDRALMADMPARAVFEAAKRRADKHLITTAINESELSHLREVFEDPYVICLQCENPVSREGDNRTAVDKYLCSTTFHYKLEQSYEVADHIYGTSKNWI